MFSVRYSAAINLKNYIKSYYPSIPPATLSYVKTSILSTLQDQNPQLRSFAGTVITEVVQQGGILAWADVLGELLRLVENQDGKTPSETQEGAMSALSKVCEDNRKVLDKEYQGERPMTIIVPKLLIFSASPNTKIRLFALKTLKALIPQKSQTLLAQLDDYLRTIFLLAEDENTEIRRVVCQSLVSLVEARPNMIAPYLPQLVEYILIQQQNENNADLALDAAEFWLSIGEQDELRGLMGPSLSKVIPVLLRSMVYREDDVIRLEGEEDDADKEDRIEDLKPQFAQAKAGRIAAGATTPIPLPNGVNGVSTIEDGELSEGEIEDDEDDELEDGDPEDAWSLRKSSAAALDVFAVNYHEPVFEIILPYLRDNLNNPEWPRREAAVLALGAIADGCLMVVAPNLPELVPFLITLLSDPTPAVRQITCWCLGRYSDWAAHQQDPEMKQKYFEPMMEGILKRMMDPNKKVQEAGASAFAQLEEKAAHRIAPYTEPILRQFIQCFQQYKDKNMYILYDCVQTLADNVGADLARPDLRQGLMSVLMGRWDKIQDESREIFPLLGCLGYVATAYGDAFAPYAPKIFDRCIRVVDENLRMLDLAMSGQSIDWPERDFVVTSLDLLSAVIQAIDPAKSRQLVAQMGFFQYLVRCTADPTSDVKQSAYALIGDCAIKTYPQLEPYLAQVVPSLTNELDLDKISDEDSENGFNVLNNVCWSAGELAAQAGPKMAQFLEPLYQGLISMVKTEGVPESVEENAAMAIGRLGIGCSDQLAPHLSEFAEPFLTSMSKINPTEEKASAFLGFNAVLVKNPRAMEASLNDYFTAIAAFPKKEMSAIEFRQVRESFGNVIQGYKQLIPDFPAFFNSLSQPVQQKLRSTYAM